jgi:hypothetical protein
MNVVDAHCLIQQKHAIRLQAQDALKKRYDNSPNEEHQKKLSMINKDFSLKDVLSAKSAKENGAPVWRISKKQRSPEFGTMFQVLDCFDKQPSQKV